MKRLIFLYFLGECFFRTFYGCIIGCTDDFEAQIKLAEINDSSEPVNST